MERRKSKKIKLGNTFIGGDSPILVQSMLNIPASNIDGSVEQAKELAAAGCQVIRFAIPNEDALNLIEPIKKAVDVPLVADIHFDYKLALGAADKLGERDNCILLIRKPLLHVLRQLPIFASRKIFLFVSVLIRARLKSIFLQNTARLHLRLWLNQRFITLIFLKNSILTIL